MRSKGLLITTVVAGLMLAGCGGGTTNAAAPPASPVPTAAPVTSTTTPAEFDADDLEFTDIELTEPTRKLTAWEQATAEIGDDGEVTVDVALQAFSVAFGKVPGVQRP